jgi:hypothetical protein
MPPRPLVPCSAAARRDRLAEYTAQYWRERKQLGAEEALRVVDPLFRQLKGTCSGWSIPEDREADLQMHILISAALARTAPNRLKAHRKRGAKSKLPASRRTPAAKRRRR